MGLLLQAEEHVPLSETWEPPEKEEARRALQEGVAHVRELQPPLEEEPVREPPPRVLPWWEQPLLQQLLPELREREAEAVERALWPQHRCAVHVVHRRPVALDVPLRPWEHRVLQEPVDLLLDQRPEVAD